MSVVLEVPASANHIMVARTTIAAAATAAGATVEEVEDLRLAVSEVCSLLLEASTGPSLTLRFEAAPGQVTIALGATIADAGTRPGSHLAWTLLEALVDDVRWDGHGPDLVVLTKQVLLGATAGP
jgi:serine/threonine-protein kinase RsbW